VFVCVFVSLYLPLPPPPLTRLMTVKVKKAI
jgi:hypothetical protein